MTYKNHIFYIKEHGAMGVKILYFNCGLYSFVWCILNGPLLGKYEEYKILTLGLDGIE